MFEEKMKIIYFFFVPVTFSLKNPRPPGAAPSLSTLSTFSICVRCLKFFGSLAYTWDPSPSVLSLFLTVGPPFA